MSSNLFVLFRRMIPTFPLQVGDVLSVDGDVAVVEMPGGGQLQARGAATVGQRVFVRNGLIEGLAPALPVETISL